jgi:hypothetical protein
LILHSLPPLTSYKWQVVFIRVVVVTWEFHLLICCRSLLVTNDSRGNFP